jgi:type II secretory pathway pseudopilin PulG
MNTRRGGGYSVLEILFVMAIAVVIVAIAIPLSGNALGFFRLSGDARSVANAVAVTKIRAASDFTQARLYIDLGARQFHLETYDKTAASWTWQTGATGLSQGVAFGFGAVASPPPNTQPAIALAPACLDNGGSAVANTACIVFNSRGIPIECTAMDPTLGWCSPASPASNDAVYLTDGTQVYGVTILPTGMMQTWRTPAGTAAWTKQ